MLRWHGRVVVAANNARSSDEFDFLLAFFESAFHLRDWLIKSKALPTATLDELFAAHIELRLCRDLANGFKHHTITHPSVDAEFAVINEYVPRGWPSQHRFPNGKWTILADGHQVGLVDLAERVVAIWRSFLASQQLDPNVR